MTRAAQLTGVVAAGRRPAATTPVNRMFVALLALIGVFISTYMSLFTIGVLDTIACGTGACEVVQNSPWAVFFGVPVPFLGLGGYAAIFALALVGIRPGRERHRGIAAALLVLTTLAFLFSMYLSWVEAALIQAWCRWCVVSAVLATLLLVAALPELTRLRSPEGRS